MTAPGATALNQRSDVHGVTFDVKLCAKLCSPSDEDHRVRSISSTVAAMATACNFSFKTPKSSQIVGANESVADEGTVHLAPCR